MSDHGQRTPTPITPTLDTTPPVVPAPWERLEGEPIRWYANFERYRLMGPSRQLIPVMRMEYQARGAGRDGAQKRAPNSLPPHWRRAIERWRWRERAEAWDMAELERLRAEEAAERKKVREDHLIMLRGYRTKVAQGITLIDPKADKLWWKSATEALAMLGREFRAMYDEEPRGRLEVTGANGEPLLPLADLVAAAGRARERRLAAEAADGAGGGGSTSDGPTDDTRFGAGEWD